MLEQLKKIGLTTGEAKVYLALFDLKEGTKYTIAKKAKVSASKVYEILDRLIEKGLVSYISKNNVKRYHPENPNKLKQYLSKKEKEIKQEQEILNQFLPTLLAKSQTEQISLNVRVFEGYNGIKSVLEEIGKELDKKSEWVAMGIRSSKKELFNNLWIHFHKERANRRVGCRFIFTDKNTSYYKTLSSLKFTNTRVIKQITPSGLAIYNNKVMIFSYTEENVSCILIEDKGISDSFKEFFNGIWKISS